MPENKNEEARLSKKEKKNKGAGKAHAVAAWEWFKSAAWLQVLLIVGVVVGIVVAIPYITQAVVNSTTNSESEFYKKNRISYSQLEGFLKGDNKDANGVIGDENSGISKDKEGFVVMFYQNSCSTCDTMQKGIETWYKDYNKKYAKNGMKFYTIDVSWVVDDKDASSKKKGTVADYDNKYITLDQQFDVQQAVKATYLAQDETHRYSSVTETLLNTRLDDPTNGAMLPTPLFVTFTKDKSAANYITRTENAYSSVIKNTTPSKVTFAPIGSLDLSTYANIATQMLDVYNFSIYRK
jgi:thioredoxin-related protein